jgi:rapamycin-insensitive companion of mTOR
MCESLIGTILFTLNQPVLRRHMRQDQDLQIFVAPFTDCYNNNPNQRMEDNMETNEQRQMKFTTTKRAILTILRSWPGLIYFCRYTCDSSQGSNAIQSLIETLHMPYEDTRRNILDLLFELLDLQQPSNLSDSEQFSFEVLSSYHTWSGQDCWQIYDGFVAAEGRSLLPHVSRSRINLFDNYLSIMLYILVSYGVVEALVQVIITTKTTMFSNSIRATILLGEILHLSSRLLPHEVYRKCHALPDLVNAATCSSHSMEVRGIASTAIAALQRMHIMRRTSVVPFSLYLDQVMRFADLSSPPHLSDMKSRLQLKTSIANEAEDIAATYVRDSNVLTHDHRSYNWTLISSVLMWPTEEFKRLEDPSYRTFIKRLVDFFKPSSRLFSQMDANDENGREIAMVGCHFVDFMLEIDDTRSSEFLGEFLRDLGNELSRITADPPNPPSFSNTTLSSTKLMTTLSHYYFLVIGRMTSSNKGSKWLENLGFYQHLSLLVSSASNDTYHKLIISSMDFTKEGFSRKILNKSLTAGSDSCRLYATNFMLVLLRTHISEFHKWALPLLVQQLYDECDSVSRAAAGILLECCDLKENLQSLISLKPSLMHLKHIGLMLQIRFVSLPIGIRFLTESRMLDSLLMEWRKTHNLKYVHIVEDAINEALTLHVKR